MFAGSGVLMGANVTCPPRPLCNWGYVAEKSPSTNRIRSQFARIKAGRIYRRRSWLPGADRIEPTRRLGIPRQHERVLSGNVGAVGRGDDAAHHAPAGLGVNPRTAG